MQGRRMGKAPQTRRPPFPGTPGLSDFERSMWRDVVLAIVGRAASTSSKDATLFAGEVVLTYRRFAEELIVKSRETGVESG